MDLGKLWAFAKEIASFGDDIALFVVGMFNVGVGVVYIFFGSCDCIAVESTPLKQEFRDYAVAMRMYKDVHKSSDKTHAAQVTIQIEHPTAEDVAQESETTESNTVATATTALPRAPWYWTSPR